MLTHTELVEKLRRLEQEHLLKYWDSLKQHAKDHLAAQIETLDEKTFWRQQSLLKKAKEEVTRTFKPFLNYSNSGSIEDATIGQKIIGDGCLGCIILAGGQGTRLNFDGPKGMFPISPVMGKTLFQLFCEKTIAASKRAGRPLPLAIMTSPQNHEQTLKYFQDNQFFGIKEHIDFFTQGVLPFLNQKGDLFLEAADTLAQGPDGNGAVLHSLVKAGIWQKWYQNDVRFINVVLIDNPLADPFDAELLGFHYHKGVDVTVKCTPRLSVDEKVGLLVEESSHVKVVEYTEMPQEERIALDSQGMFKHSLANLSLFCLNMEFALQIAETVDMPLHLAYKPAAVLSDKGAKIKPREPNAWKFERFIFDILPYASKVAALLYPREVCFAPLKRAEGADSIDTVKIAMKKRDKDVLKKITGLPSPERDFELSQDFYYPTSEILIKWKGRTAPHKDYLIASAD